MFIRVDYKDTISEIIDDDYFKSGEQPIQAKKKVESLRLDELDIVDEYLDDVTFTFEELTDWILDEMDWVIYNRKLE